MKPNNRIIAYIPCGWRGCSTQCDSDMNLSTHIAEHLTTGQSSLASTDSGRYQCCWRDCDFECECYREMGRHMYYHGYYDGLVVRGKLEVATKPNLPKCKINSDKTTADRIPELKCDFICSWTDCVRSYASVVEFHDHLVQHCHFEYDIQRTNDNLHPAVLCGWNFCRKRIQNKYRLIEHTHTHAHKKHYACPHCGEVFRTRTILIDHRRRQSDNETHKYQCNHCYKSFPTEKLLRLHVATHVNCFKCSQCDMTCSSAAALATHVRYRHLKDKPFKCQQCDHRCVREADLAKHVQFIHTKKEHHCDQAGCNYTVRTYNLLRRHYLEVHANSPFIYVCHCCDKIFKSGKSLSVHLMRKHDYKLPSGHKRFTYRIDEDGFYRLETKRIESLEVTKQILSPNPFEVSDVTQDSNCFDIVSITNETDARVIASHDEDVEIQSIGEVIISLPNIGNH